MFTVACAVCKHKRKSPVCDDCLKEKKSGFEMENFYVGRIECFECDSPYCGGCNIFILTKMLQDRKFNCLMDEHCTINPYIEFKPVEHGRWRGMKAYKNEYICSECGNLWPDEKSPYCPNCGAKMEVSDDTT